MINLYDKDWIEKVLKQNSVETITDYFTKEDLKIMYQTYVGTKPLTTFDKRRLVQVMRKSYQFKVRNTALLNTKREDN